MIYLLTDEQRDFLKETEQLDTLIEWEQGERTVNQIYEHLLAGKLTFYRKSILRYQEGFVHPDPRQKHLYQFTYYDHHGPVGHTNKDDIITMAKTIRSYGFFPIEKTYCTVLN